MKRIDLAVCAAALLSASAAFAADADLCWAPAGATAIIAPLEHVAARIDEGGPLTVVAVGSSSTAGIGASDQSATYPSRLAAELRRRLPTLPIEVLNRGKSGEDAPEELARLPLDVVALRPDLAIWQVGTNAVLRRDDLAADAARLREGVDLLTRNGIDVVLMDLQYAPRVLERSAYPVMEDIVAETADFARVGLFRRFELMRYWHRTHAADAPPMVGADGLHMTDAGYACLAADLARALEANWRAETKLARRVRSPSDTVAGLPRPAAGPSDMHDAVRRNDAAPFN
ncbi:MAG: SGNH/GDSL hydrolase family protein [Alphaproteobacteria bacterium]|nr:SGNH/GDSL hydrolase family protein [Alphaproteobacteria bacterium]